MAQRPQAPGSTAPFYQNVPVPQMAVPFAPGMPAPQFYATAPAPVFRPPTGYAAPQQPQPSPVSAAATTPAKRIVLKDASGAEVALPPKAAAPSTPVQAPVPAAAVSVSSTPSTPISISDKPPAKTPIRLSAGPPTPPKPAEQAAPSAPVVAPVEEKTSEAVEAKKEAEATSDVAPAPVETPAPAPVETSAPVEAPAPSSHPKRNLSVDIAPVSIVENAVEKLAADAELPQTPSASSPSGVPQSPSSRTRYSRDLLMQYKPRTNELPPDAHKLTSSEVYLDPKQAALSPMNNGARLQTPRPHQPGQPQKSVSRPPASGNMMYRQPEQRATPGFKKSENAWVPSKNKSEMEKIKGAVRSILNKLTPENYARLKEQVMALDIKDSDTLVTIISLIYEKAVDEPNFSKMYAVLCRDIQAAVPVFSSGGSSAESAEEPKKEVQFKRILVTRCQEEFEREDVIPNRESMSAEELEEAERKIRKRKAGNIKFVGELFKEQMLGVKIMHSVIRAILFKNGFETEYLPSEQELEILCKFLTTVGKALDTPSYAELINRYFARLKELARTSSLPSRIRFMIQDVVDLRDLLRWVPRMKENEAKTIEQVHAEAKHEEMIKARGGAPVQPKAQTKLGINANVPPRGAVVVAAAPAGGAWKTANSSLTKKNGPSAAEIAANTQFSRGKRAQPSPPRREEPAAAPQAPKAPASPVAAPVAAAPVELSQEERETRINGLLEHYLATLDVKTAEESLQDLNSPAAHSHLVHTFIMKILEQDPKKKSVADLLQTFGQSGAITADMFAEAFTQVLHEMVDFDLATDVPLCYKVAGFFVGHLLQAKCATLSAANGVFEAKLAWFVGDDMATERNKTDYFVSMLEAVSSSPETVTSIAPSIAKALGEQIKTNVVSKLSELGLSEIVAALNSVSA